MKTEFEKKLKKAVQSRTHEVSSNSYPMFLDKLKEEMVSCKKEQRISFFEFFIRQIRYLSYSVWLLQGSMLLLLIGFLTYVYGTLSIQNGKQVAMLLCGSTLLIIISSIPAIKRSLRYRMNEVEAATSFSLSKLLLAKLLIIGMGNTIMIGGTFGITVFYTSIGMLPVLLYLLIPFLLMTSFVLYLIGHVKLEKLSAYCVVGCLLVLGVGGLMLEYCPWMFTKMFTLGWIVIGVVLLGISIRQICYISLNASVVELQVV